MLSRSDSERQQNLMIHDQRPLPVYFSLHPCALDESSPSIRRVNGFYAYWPMPAVPSCFLPLRFNSEKVPRLSQLY